MLDRIFPSRAAPESPSGLWERVRDWSGRNREVERAECERGREEGLEAWRVVLGGAKERIA
jgi:hypothetical protein